MCLVPLLSFLPFIIAPRPPKPKRCPWGRDRGLLTQVQDFNSVSLVPSTWSLNYHSLMSLCPLHVDTLISCQGLKRSMSKTEILICSLLPLDGGLCFRIPIYVKNYILLMIQAYKFSLPLVSRSDCVFP